MSLDNIRARAAHQHAWMLQRPTLTGTRYCLCFGCGQDSILWATKPLIRNGKKP